jgi:hypothetical protein
MKTMKMLVTALLLLLAAGPVLAQEPAPRMGGVLWNTWLTR